MKRGLMKESIKFRYFCEDEFREFLDSLPDKVAAKLIQTIKHIEMEGLRVSLEMQWVDKLEDNLYEIRVRSNGVFPRCIFFKDNSNKDYIIVWYFKKKSNRTPQKEIEKAIHRRLEYLA